MLYCTVVSYVIYLKKDGSIVESPLIRAMPDGSEIFRLHFVSIKLWEMTASELRDTGLVGLLPLLPLTKDGGTRQVVEEIVTRLLGISGRETQANLLAIAFTLSSLALEGSEERSWLIRRFRMLQDLLRETPIYQIIIQEGKQQGIEEARREDMEKFSRVLLSFIQNNHPELLYYAREQITSVKSVEALTDLTLKVVAAKTADDVRRLLSEAKGADRVKQDGSG